MSPLAGRESSRCHLLVRTGPRQDHKKAYAMYHTERWKRVIRYNVMIVAISNYRPLAPPRKIHAVFSRSLPFSARWLPLPLHRLSWLESAVVSLLVGRACILMAAHRPLCQGPVGERGKGLNREKGISRASHRYAIRATSTVCTHDFSHQDDILASHKQEALWDIRISVVDKDSLNRIVQDQIGCVRYLSVLACESLATRIQKDLSPN